MFEYLMQTINRLVMIEIGNDYRKRMSRLAISWCTGCADRLRERLRERHSNYLKEQAEKAEEARKQAKHPASPSHGALVVVMKDYAQEQEDLNRDFRLNLKPGHTAKQRAEKEAAKIKKYDDCRAAGYDNEVAIAFADMFFENFQAAYDWCYPDEEQQAEADKYWEKEEKRRDKRREREWAKRDWSAHRKGQDAGSKIGLDAQIGKGSGLKSIK